MTKIGNKIRPILLINLNEIVILDHLTCLLRNLYAGQEVTVKPDMKQSADSKLKRSMSRLYIVTLLI